MGLETGVKKTMQTMRVLSFGVVGTLASGCLEYNPLTQHENEVIQDTITREKILRLYVDEMVPYMEADKLFSPTGETGAKAFLAARDATSENMEEYYNNGKIVEYDPEETAPPGMTQDVRTQQTNGAFYEVDDDIIEVNSWVVAAYGMHVEWLIHEAGHINQHLHSLEMEVYLNSLDIEASYYNPEFVALVEKTKDYPYLLTLLYHIPEVIYGVPQDRWQKSVEKRTDLIDAGTMTMQEAYDELSELISSLDDQETYCVTYVDDFEKYKYTEYEGFGLTLDQVADICMETPALYENTIKIYNQGLDDFVCSYDGCSDDDNDVEIVD